MPRPSPTGIAGEQAEKRKRDHRAIDAREPRHKRAKIQEQFVLIIINAYCAALHHIVYVVKPANEMPITNERRQSWSAGIN